MTAALLGVRKEFNPPLLAESKDDVRAGFQESVSSAFNAFTDENWSISESQKWGKYMTREQDAASELAGFNRQLPYKYHRYPWYDDAMELVKTNQYRLEDGEIVPLSKEAGRIMSLAGKQNIEGMLYRQDLIKNYPDRFLTDEQILGEITKETAATREEAAKVAARSDLLPQILGTIGGAVADPLVLATLPIGAGGAAATGAFNALRLAARAGATEAGIAAAIETVIQAQNYQFKKSIESPFTKMDALINIASAGFGAGVLRATGSLAVDAISLVERSLVDRGFRQALERSGVDPAQAQRIVETSRAYEDSRPPGIDLQTHSATMDAAVRSMDEGRLPEVDLTVARAADDAFVAGRANRFLDDRVASLLPEAGNKLERGTRKLLDRELVEMEQRLTFIKSDERLRELNEIRIAEGMSGSRRKQQAKVDQAREVKEMGEQIDALRAKILRDDKAKEAFSELSRIEQGRLTSPVKEAERLGFKRPENLARMVKVAMDNTRVDPRPASVEARAVAEAASVAPPPKPKVDKGTGKPVETRADAPETRADTPEPVQPPILPDEIKGVQVSVDANPDGTPATKTALEVFEETDAELRALDAVEACLNG